MNPITEFFKFLYDDIKTDIQFLIHCAKCIAKGKPILREGYFTELKEEAKGLRVTDILKTYWLMYLLFAAFFITGYWVSSQVHQQKCNEFIYEHYASQLNPLLNASIPSENYSLNLSFPFEPT